ncbi:hypothetical protein [Rathayibacter sp. VKM Ac-2760]|uniref:hypothetical protein n=1 Tax=Rathayibacter sp. VKM Ac-2760 TaxID=2609253 RepID=UPI0013188BD8|nr:hypothetical protein [Rathayibacter sp. VKM Ac-2760]QHC58529.1 hypothetical protein GSU72_08220 [Rathayibacter sp. VKM Ac-2760]
MAALDEHDLLDPRGAAPEESGTAEASVPRGDEGGAEPAAAPASEQLDALDGLTVTTPRGSLSLAPVTEAVGTEVQPGVLLYEGEHADYVLTSSDDAAAAAGYAVIKGAEAPEEYRFEVTASGAAAHLALTDAGAVTVSDSLGDVVNTIAAPWAIDAEGAPVDTWYEIDGSTVLQHLRHQGAAYPVVADPSVECDAAFCTLLLSRSDTHRLASDSGAVTVVLAFLCGGASWACELGAAVAIDAANRAEDEGKCVGVRHLHYVAVASFPVSEPCKE